MPDTPAHSDPAAARTRVVNVLLCPSCAGYKPMTPEGYDGFLSGQCQGCQELCRELHRFPALVVSATACRCRSQHGRVTGDVGAGLPGGGAQ